MTECEISTCKAESMEINIDGWNDAMNRGLLPLFRRFIAAGMEWLDLGPQKVFLKYLTIKFFPTEISVGI